MIELFNNWTGELLHVSVPQQLNFTVMPSSIEVEVEHKVGEHAWKKAVIPLSVDSVIFQ